MGSRYKEEKPFSFYDPEQDRERQRQTPRNRSAPVSPRAPLSPRAQPSGHSFYNPEVDHAYSRSGPPTSPRESPFRHYDPELDRERQRQGTSYGSEPRAPPTLNEVDSRAVGRGAPPPPLPYIKQDPGSLPLPHGAQQSSTYGRGAPGPGYAGRGAPEPGYGGRGALEPGYAGRVAPVRPYPPQPNQDFAGASGGGRGYGGGEPGYPRPVRPAEMDDDLGRGRGRGSPVPPLGGGRYVYGGLQQPQKAAFEQDYDAPPAPISSEYAHQVYASVFSDPVYGGAGQFNSRAGYSEEPEELQQLHHEDLLRHPDQY